MSYTITVAYYDGPSITDEHQDMEEAFAAWEDQLWAAAYGPKDQVGDIRAVTLRHGDKMLQSRTYP